MQLHNLAVYKGWSELIATNVALQRNRNHPYNASRLTIADDVQKLHEWYRDKTPTVYTLGERAVMLAFAHFTFEQSDSRESSHIFDIEIYGDEARKSLPNAFMEAIHYDLLIHSQYYGDIWSVAGEHDVAKLRVLQNGGYRPQATYDDSNGSRSLLLRRGVKNFGID